MGRGIDAHPRPWRPGQSLCRYENFCANRNRRRRWRDDVEENGQLYRSNERSRIIKLIALFDVPLSGLYLHVRLHPIKRVAILLPSTQEQQNVRAAGRTRCAYWRA